MNFLLIGRYYVRNTAYLIKIKSFFSVTLTNHQLENIANKIIEIFPSEVKETYYVPPLRKALSKDGKPGIAKGKLVDKYRNCQYQLRKGDVKKNANESAFDEASTSMYM